MKQLAPRWILLSRRPDLRLADARVFRSFKGALARLQRGEAHGLLIDATFRDRSGNAWTVAYAARELFPKISITVLNGLSSHQKSPLREHMRRPPKTFLKYPDKKSLQDM